MYKVETFKVWLHANIFLFFLHREGQKIVPLESMKGFRKENLLIIVIYKQNAIFNLIEHSYFSVEK